MRILNILAQKPYSTGSGVYFVETIKEFEKLGHECGAVFACYGNENFDLGENTITYKLIFDTKDLPFHIFGMSDTMPYVSMKYKNMTSEIFNVWKDKFINLIDSAILSFKPDIIICHHLYLLTAIVREKYKNIKIYGICHNTDLRQYIKTDFMREYISDNICKLDKIFAPTDYHKKLICELYGASIKNIVTVGIGYNNKIFISNNIARDEKHIRFLYVGKVSKKKGLLVLLDSFADIIDDRVILDIVGSAGDEEEYNEILSYAHTLKIKVNFLGKKTHEELNIIYNNVDYLVMPTFFDAIPLTMIEAIACGCKIIISNLPGLCEYISENTDGAYIRYIDMPKMKNADETTDEEIAIFTKKLKTVINDELKIRNNVPVTANLSKLSWNLICNDMLADS